MGLFDTIRCQMPLPEGGWPHPPPSTTFQTKDMPDPRQDFYTIGTDGRLLLIDWRNGSHTEVSFEGPLGFYEIIPETGEQWEYETRFEQCRCVDLRLVRYEEPNRCAFPRPGPNQFVVDLVNEEEGRSSVIYTIVKDRSEQGA